MNEIEKSRISEICQLHAEIGGYLRMSLEKAIRIGELLTEQKAGMKHGEWFPWIEANCLFSERLARDYMRFYYRQEDLKTARVADLAEARRFLSKGRDVGEEVRQIFSNLKTFPEMISALQVYIKALRKRDGRTKKEVWMQETGQDRHNDACAEIYACWFAGAIIDLWERAEKLKADQAELREKAWDKTVSLEELEKAIEPWDKWIEDLCIILGWKI